MAKYSGHVYRILIIGGFGSGKTNVLLNLIKEKDIGILIDQIYLYAKHQLLIKKNMGKYRNKTFKKSKSIYRIFKYNG